MSPCFGVGLVIPDGKDTRGNKPIVESCGACGFWVGRCTLGAKRTNLQIQRPARDAAPRNGGLGL